jgi:hypothetical protein
MTTTEFDRELRAWLEQTEPRQAPDGIVTRAVAVTRRTRQRRGFVGELSALARTRPWQAWRLAPYAGVILVTALLAAGLLAAALIGSQPRRPSGSGWVPLTVAAGAIEGSAHVTGVVTAGPGVVAIGNSLADGDDGCRVGRAHTWTSTDGRTWRESAVLVDANFERVVAGDERMYALGYSGWQYEPSPEGCGWGHGRRVAWSSVDGATWQLIDGLPADEAFFMTTAAEAHGALVAFLTEQSAVGEEPTRATQVWRATDSGWVHTTTIEDALIVQATSAEGVLVALGFVEPDQETSQAWVSSDGGATWRAASALPRGTQLFSVAAGANGLVGVGARAGRSGIGTPVVATSSDGLTWTVSEHTEGELVQIDAVDGAFIAASGEWVDSEQPTACPPPALASPSASPLGSQPAGSDERAETPSAVTPEPTECTASQHVADTWVSVDGIEWRRGPVMPAATQPLVADPVPAPVFRFAQSTSGVVAANPYFGAQVWVIPDETLAVGPR